MINPSPNLLAAAAMTFMPAAGMANTMASPFIPAPHASLFHHEDSNILVPEAGRTVEQRFDAISKLPRGWDGGDAQPVSADSIERAKRLVEFARSLPGRNGMPAVVPCADGSVQIEWHLRDSRFEMYFETDGSTSAWWHDRASGQEIEAEGANAAVLLGQWAVRDAAWFTMAIAA